MKYSLAITAATAAVLVSGTAQAQIDGSRVDLQIISHSGGAVAMGSDFTVELNAYGADVPMSALQMALEWDPHMLTLVSHETLVPASFQGFPFPPSQNPCTLANLSWLDGNALYVLLPTLGPATDPVATPEGTPLVELTFRALAPGQATIGIPASLENQGVCDYTAVYWSTGLDVTGELLPTDVQIAAGAVSTDFNDDGCVDVADLVIVLNACGTDDLAADCTGDSKVDMNDVIKVVMHWGCQ